MIFTLLPRVGVLLTLAGLALTGAASGQAGPGRAFLPGHRTLAAALGRRVGRVPASQNIPLTLALAARDTQGLDDLLHRQADRLDPLHGRFLTPAQFVTRFSPTPAQCAAVADFARSQGLTVTGLSADRLLLHLSAPSSAVEAAFGVHLAQFLGAGGRVFHAPDAEPSVPASVAPLIADVVGLDDSVVLRPHLQALEPDRLAALDAVPLQTGGGPGGALRPSDIRAAYGLSGVGLTGSGQTLALVELDGYAANDISDYENSFGLPQVPLQNVVVDGVDYTRPGGGQAEVTLDIELQAALAPGAGKILVYQGPNSGQGVLDTYSRIATDDMAQQISTSWGLSEGGSGTSLINAESVIFKKMAAQGQTMFAAAGDSGAYDDGSTLSVDDPASQPYITGVGGTSLRTASVGGPYGSETTWNSGGGGVSAVWSAPYWQQGVVSAASLGSAAMRNVPDVALAADPNTGYDILLNGGWYIYGGTSCAAPLWAAFTALVNQQRAANGAGPLGFANPALYAIGSGQFGRGAADFHDIADGSTNNNGRGTSFYPAVTGYDDATGWGSFNGAALLADLAAVPPPPPPPALTATAGNAQVSLSWSAATGATAYNLYRSSTGAGGVGPAPHKVGLTGNSYTDTGLTNGTTYYYTLSATNPGGESAVSNEASAAPLAPAVATSAGGAVWWQMGDPGIGHVVGRVDAGGWSADTNLDPAGFMQYGPYTKQIVPGAQTALWTLLVDNTTHAGDPGPLVELQAYDHTTDTLLAARDVRRAEFSAPFQYQAFALPFSLPAAAAGDQVELRAYWYPYSYVREQSVAVSAYAWGAQDPTLGHVVGRVDAGGWSADTNLDPAGFMQYGPYTKQIVPGAQTALWTLLVDNTTHAGDPGPLVELQAYDHTTDTLLAARDVRRAEFSAPFQYQAFALPFSLPAAAAGDQVELRAYWYPYSYVREQSVSLGGTP